MDALRCVNLGDLRYEAQQFHLLFFSYSAVRFPFLCLANCISSRKDGLCLIDFELYFWLRNDVIKISQRHKDVDDGYYNGDDAVDDDDEFNSNGKFNV